MVVIVLTDTYVGLKFYHTLGSNISLTQVAIVEVSTNGGTNWTTVKTVNIETGNQVYVDLTATCSGQNSVLVRFHYVGNSDEYWKIDDVLIFGY